jgi:hypothetical protein
MEDNRPLHTMSYGAVRVSIWANQTSLGTFYNVMASRSYKKDENWHDSTSFGEFDLPILAKAILDAHSWIQAHKKTDRVDLALPPPPDPTDDVSGYDG